MRESLKAVCLAVLIFAVPTALVVWLLDNPSDEVWMTRWFSTAVSIVAFGLFLKLQLARDVVPDLLRQNAGDYFNQDGFCFVVGSQVIDGVFHFQVWFQNQHEKACQGIIWLQPARGFWMNRPDIADIEFVIDCEPAAFGTASLPFPLDRELHGKKQEFEVRATADYPCGKGRRLRFYPGQSVGSESKGAASARAVLSAAGLLAGMLVWHKEARLRLELPMSVASELTEPAKQTTETIWKLSDDVEAASASRQSPAGRN